MSVNPAIFMKSQGSYPTATRPDLPITLSLDKQCDLSRPGIYDISPDGLQVRCTRAMSLQALNPRGKRIKYQ